MRTLIAYEFKKIFARKVVWVSLAISLLLIAVTIGGSLLGSTYVDGERVSSNYEEFQIDRGYQEALDGRKIDDKLIGEMREAYSKVPLEEDQYSRTEEYQKYARPYSAVYNYIRQNVGLSGEELLQWAAGVSVESLQELRLARQEQRWEDYYLTEAEKVYWREQEAQIENPVIFRYAESYSVLINAVYTIGLLTIFMVALCLAGIFPEEHIRRTDQLVLSSKHGRGKIFGAKFLAGMLFAFMLSVLFVAVTIGLAFVLYGVEGFDGAFQLIYAGSSQPISVGEAVLIAYFMVIFAGMFTGALVLFLSEVFRSSVGTLAVVVGIIMLPMYLSVPDEYRFWAQLWSYLPGDFVAVWSIFSPRTLPLFGKLLQGYQVVPVLYTGLGILFAVGAERLFVKYQINGR